MSQRFLHVDSSSRAKGQAFIHEIDGLSPQNRQNQSTMLFDPRYRRTRGFAVGNKVLNGFFFLNGSALMYSRDLADVIA